ncbi:MAG: cupin domain-containing protein [Methyloligellaceae bacterium]
MAGEARSGFELRRVVTGHNAEGRSVVMHDGPEARLNGNLYEVWNIDGGVQDTSDTDDRGLMEVNLSPVARGSNFRWFVVPPVDPSISHEQLEEIIAKRFAGMGASHERVDTSRHPAMHKTKTIDYIILLSGHVTLMLDEEERDLKPFDVVVQQATNHAWINKGNEPALLCAVLIDADIE